MTFEEQIASAFQTLTERLRGDVDREVQRRTAEIAAAAPPPVAPAPVEASPRPDSSSAARLTEAVRSIDAARSLTGILDALVTAARAEATSADVWLSRGGRLHHWRSSGSDSASPEAPSGSLVVPIAIAGADVAFLYAEVGEHGTTNDEPRTTNVEQRTANVELLTRYAARSLEALTAFKTARALTQRAGAATTPEPAASDDASAEEDTSARRYARLLVSEIKLYHEAAVIEARRDRDLARRLGGEINRARAMYEQRVPPHVRERGDYFHDELVRTLADGDGSLLELRTENVERRT
jgi:hypothetical protein